MQTRREKILDKLTKLYPEDDHEVKVDRLRGGDRILSINTTAPTGKVKGLFWQEARYIFVHPIVRAQEGDTEETPF